MTRVTHTNFEPLNSRNCSAPPTITITSPTADPAIDGEDTVHRAGGHGGGAEGIVSVAFANNRGGSGAVTGTT